MVNVGLSGILIVIQVVMLIASYMIPAAFVAIPWFVFWLPVMIVIVLLIILIITATIIIVCG